ncbi:hypothetical protein [Piscirickettsia litoralis]|uniref:Uncharacterized protein n=1 Tax=Piscirickettsia litoralis TaxID=1891921 RepID=A0ABX3A8J8_9GAMM|nr:hypothetical protein [Piscirickettsia litoralis]ODN42449.1 hypothetical protein BGC07_05270 [Piscirickettsia litoralis]
MRYNFYKLKQLFLSLIALSISQCCYAADVNPTIKNNTDLPFQVYVSNQNCMNIHDNGDGTNYIVAPGDTYKFSADKKIMALA